MRRNILIIGATGKQGRSLVRALVYPDPKSPNNPSSSSFNPSDDLENAQNGSYEYHIYALTRDPSSLAARSLLSIDAELHSPDSDGENPVDLVKGDLDDEKLIEKVFEDVKPWGVFACVAFPGLGADAAGEERTGKVILIGLIRAFSLRLPQLPFSDVITSVVSNND